MHWWARQTRRRRLGQKRTKDDWRLTLRKPVNASSRRMVEAIFNLVVFIFQLYQIDWWFSVLSFKLLWDWVFVLFSVKPGKLTNWAHISKIGVLFYHLLWCFWIVVIPDNVMLTSLSLYCGSCGTESSLLGETEVNWWQVPFLYQRLFLAALVFCSLSQ